jgi:hypothetical protein
MLLTPLGQRAVPAPISGRVIATTFRDWMPLFDETWNVQDLLH